MLRVQGRAASGVAGILRVLSAMAEDAITDEVAERNPFRGVVVRTSDPRVRKRVRPIRVFSFDAMHRFARAAGTNEAMVRVFTDAGLRLGEVLPLRRCDFDGENLRVCRTAHEGTVQPGTKVDHGDPEAGRLVPVPPTLGTMLEATMRSSGPAGDLLFQTPTGKMWREGGFYRSVWRPTQESSGMDIRTHECRHSYITLLRRHGIDDADLAEIAGSPASNHARTLRTSNQDKLSDVRRAIG